MRTWKCNFNFNFATIERIYSLALQFKEKIDGCICTFLCVGSSTYLVIAKGIMLLNRRDRRRSFVAIARIIENREKEIRGVWDSRRWNSAEYFRVSGKRARRCYKIFLWGFRLWRYMFYSTTVSVRHVFCISFREYSRAKRGKVASAWDDDNCFIHKINWISLSRWYQRASAWAFYSCFRKKRAERSCLVSRRYIKTRECQLFLDG